MRILLAAAAALLLALTASADPVINSISPSVAPAAGGTTVVIRGSGFATCPICSPPSPPAVYFGQMPAASVVLTDSSTLIVVTPPMIAMTVDVTVSQFGGSAWVPQAFTFTGASDYQPVLMPVFTAEVAGAFGSKFVTEVSAANRGTTPVNFLGLDTSCFLSSPVLGPLSTRTIEAGVGKTTTIPTNCNYGRVARLLYVRSADLEHASFGIRVHDTSRDAISHGTEIPVVRMSDTTTGPLVFAQVPTDERFRAMLRVYTMSNQESQVAVTVNGITSYVTLEPGADPFEPAYGTFTDFPRHDQLPSGEDKVTVTVRPVVPITSPPSSAERFWAFITVTNNTTQEITTITPDL